MPPIGLGCMTLSHAYGVPPDAETGRQVLDRALDVGYVHFDSAALYGFGKNELLLGAALQQHRDRIFLVSKGGLVGVDGKRVMDARPESLKSHCEDSLKRLRTDVIDLYYLHRWQKTVPIEDSVGALKELVHEGKVRQIGLSEVSAGTLKKAHAVHPIAALQSEFSLWSRNAEIATLDACAELGVAYVAFSPLARGFLADLALDPGELVAKDLRLNMPRFQAPHFERNAALRREYADIAAEVGCTPAQLALAWLLQRAPHLHVIPGTTNPDHAEENFKAIDVVLDPSVINRLEVLINPGTISGARYSAATQAEIDTEIVPEERRND